MERALKLVASVAFLLLVSQDIARADFWARTDRPWSYWELKNAIHYCRVRPRITDNTLVFIDVVMGREIDKCMYSLGWVGVAR